MEKRDSSRGGWIRPKTSEVQQPLLENGSVTNVFTVLINSSLEQDRLNVWSHFSPLSFLAYKETIRQSEEEKL